MIRTKAAIKGTALGHLRVSYRRRCRNFGPCPRFERRRAFPDEGPKFAMLRAMLSLENRVALDFPLRGDAGKTLGAQTFCFASNQEKPS